MTSTPASRATPAPEREAQLLSIGKQCSEATCPMVDFLPFKCQHCQQSFCQKHFKVDAHRCPEYDGSKHDRVAPNCKAVSHSCFGPGRLNDSFFFLEGPLCNTPVAIPLGQDPNIRMDTHLTNECSVMTGRAKAKTSRVCAKGNCKKVLFSPIKCTVRLSSSPWRCLTDQLQRCQAQFCPSHRFPADHNCAMLTPVQGARASKTAGSRLLDEFSGNKLNNKASAASSAVMKTVSSASASLSKSIANSKITAPPLSNSSSTTTSSPAKSPGNNPFSKVDRWAHSAYLVKYPLIKHSAVSLPLTAMIVQKSSSNTRLMTAKHDNQHNDPTTLTHNSFTPPPLFACA